MDVEVLGLVENMAYFKCDDCGKEHHIFGEPQGAEVAERYNIPAYTTLPIDPKFARLCDEGKVEDYDVEGKLDVIIDKIVEAGEKQDGGSSRITATPPQAFRLRKPANPKGSRAFVVTGGFWPTVGANHPDRKRQAGQPARSGAWGLNRDEDRGPPLQMDAIQRLISRCRTVTDPAKPLVASR